ncbi:MAG: LpqB family beta-propeller domain-containing protein [Actinomycetota bacterium]|nr:LpqB family beta-propeller domain-containing protein [Actinomycetota bacterium]
MTSPLRGAAVLLSACCLLAGCGLPLPEGVSAARAGTEEQRLPEPISVLPPGPQPGATPQEVVLGFLAAQSSARDDHRVAREFLAAPVRSEWDDDAGVTMYDPRTVSVAVAPQQGREVVVTLGFDVVGAVAPDGSARVSPPARATRRYRLGDDGGQWRLLDVPAGLTLSPAERERAYAALQVHFLAPAAPGAVRHLVADLVHLPAEVDRAGALVSRLLAGPSAGLAGSAQTAVPPGTRLLSPVRTSAQGEVAVDLSGEVGALPDDARRDLSAQLVWTLRQVADFSRLRLLVDGVPLDVPGVAAPQPRLAWGAYDPDASGASSPATAIVDGALRPLDPLDAGRPPAAPDLPELVDVAVDPRSDRLAALSAGPAGRRLVLGPRGGPFTPAATGSLRSPTWGSGEHGLWLLRAGLRPAVLLLRPEHAGPVEVGVPGLPPLTPDALLRVSRDGVRVAVVTGGVLYVGRVVPGAPPVEGPLRVEGLRRLATGVLDVAWRTGTALSVLVDDDTAPRLPLLALSVDGTSSTASGLLGVPEGSPVAVAAYGSEPLLVQVRADGRSTIYSGDGGRGYQVRLRDATRPAYPR